MLILRRALLTTLVLASRLAAATPARDEPQLPSIAVDKEIVAKIGITLDHLKEVFSARPEEGADIEHTAQAEDLVSDLESYSTPLAANIERNREGAYTLSLLMYACPQSKFTLKRLQESRFFAPDKQPLTRYAAALGRLVNQMKDASPKDSKLLREALSALNEARDLAKETPEGASYVLDESYPKNPNIDVKQLIPKTPQEHRILVEMYSDRFQEKQKNYYAWPDCNTWTGAPDSGGLSPQDRLGGLLMENPFSSRNRKPSPEDSKP